MKRDRRSEAKELMRRRVKKEGNEANNSNRRLIEQN